MNARVLIGCTPDYESRAFALRDTMESFGTRPLIGTYPGRGEWLANTRAKSEVILRYVGGTPLLWVDADTAMLSPLDEDDLDAWEEDFDFVARRKPPDKPHHYYTGVMFFNATSAALDLANRFTQCCIGDTDAPGRSDEHWFEATHKEMAADVRWGGMSRRYLWLPRDGEPEEDVVFHAGISKIGARYAQKGLL